MKATLLLQKDHEKVRELFQSFRGAKGAAQTGTQALVDEMRREIRVHSHIETEIFYPALRDTTSRQAEEFVEAALADHEQIEKLLAEIPNGGATDKGFETKVNRLIDTVDAHILREEEQLFDEARNTLSEQRLEELGLEMEDRRRLLLQKAA